MHSFYVVFYSCLLQVVENLLEIKTNNPKISKIVFKKNNKIIVRIFHSNNYNYCRMVRGCLSLFCLNLFLYRDRNNTRLHATTTTDKVYLGFRWKNFTIGTINVYNKHETNVLRF